MKFSAQASPALVLFAVILSVLTGPSRSQAQDDAAVTEIVRQFNEIEEMLPRMETLFIDASHAESDLGIGAITVWFDPQTLYTKVRNELTAGSSTEVQEMWIQGDTLLFIFERTEYQNDNGDTDVHELRYYLHNGRVIREMSRNATLRNGRNLQLSGVPHETVDDLDPEYAHDLFRSKQEKSEKMSLVARGVRMRNPNLPPLVNQSYRILLDTISPDGQFAVAFSIDGVPNPDWNQWQIDRFAYLDTLGERTYRTHLVSIWNGAIVGDLNTLYDPYGPLHHWTQWSPGAQLFVVGVNARWMSPEAVLYRIENGRSVQVSNLEQELSRMAMQAMTQVNHPYTIDTTEASGFITIEAITDGGRLDVDYRIESKFEGDRYNAYIDLIAQVDPWSGQTTVISAVLPEYIPKPSTWKALTTEIITSASRWLANPPGLEDYLRTDTVCENNGVVMLFNRFGDLFNPGNVELIIRRPLFLSGPHQFGMITPFEPHDFGRYDPISVAMINDELSSVLQTPGFVTATQSLYHARFQSTVVDFQEALRYWESNPAELQRQKAGYLQRIANQTLPDGYYLLENNLAQTLMESYTTDYDRQLGFLTALRFWLRRECDGTYADFASMLQKMVKAYDPGYFSTHGLPGRLIEPHPGGDDEDDIVEVVMDEDGALGINEKTPLNLASLQAQLSNFRVAPGEILEEGAAIPAFKVFLGSSEVLTVTDFGTGDPRSFEARSDNMQLKNGISTGDTFGQVFALQYPPGFQRRVGDRPGRDHRRRSRKRADPPDLSTTAGAVHSAQRSLSTSPRRVEPFRSRRDEVAAMNQSNHFFHWLACVVFAVSLSLSSDAEDRVALIIGIDDYQSEEIPDLEGAIRDARLMSDSLKQISPSFEVQLLENPSLDDVFDAIEQFGVSARRAQCALFYFAGHGIEFHGENFLLTGDSSITDNIETGVEATKRRLRRKMLSLNVVMDEIELTQADLKLLVLDACRNNPIEINEGGKTRSLGGTRGLARVSAPLGMLVSYSADAGQVANDGLFTEVLAKNLIEPKLSVMEVFAKTRDEVSAISKKRKEEDSRYNLQLPAEYNKLGWAGIKFVFNPETTPTPPGPTNPSTPSTSPSMPRNPNTPRENTGTAPPSSDFDNSMGMRMVSIPGGSFNMGDLGGDGDQSETPVRQVELSPFHIGATEVTQDQWASLMGESISDLRREAGFSGESPFGSGPNHPVYYVSWEAAVEFCNRLTERERTRSGLSKSFIYRLPTEAEWEFACRAGWEEPFGGDPFEMGKIAGFGGADPVGQFNANDFRLHDMHGNVWEWCQDYYRPNYAGLSTRDPVGPTSGDTRVFRGGSWLDGIRAARSSSRGFALPTLRHRTVGFRVVLGTRP